MLSLSSICFQLQIIIILLIKSEGSKVQNHVPSKPLRPGKPGRPAIPFIPRAPILPLIPGAPIGPGLPIYQFWKEGNLIEMSHFKCMKSSWHTIAMNFFFKNRFKALLCARARTYLLMSFFSISYPFHHNLPSSLVAHLDRSHNHHRENLNEKYPSKSFICTH